MESSRTFSHLRIMCVPIACHHENKMVHYRKIKSTFLQRKRLRSYICASLCSGGSGKPRNQILQKHAQTAVSKDFLMSNTIMGMRKLLDLHFWWEPHASSLMTVLKHAWEVLCARTKQFLSLGKWGKKSEFQPHFWSRTLVSAFNKSALVCLQTLT